MTQPIILDREITIPITRTRTVPTGDSWTFDDGGGVGGWFQRFFVVTFGGPDNTGKAIPLPSSLDAGDIFTLTDENGVTFTGDIRSASVVIDPFGQRRPNTLALEFEGQPPTFSGVLTLATPVGEAEITSTVQTPVFAERVDVSGRDTLSVSSTSIINVAIRFYSVRYDDGFSLQVGNKMVDDEGVERTIVGLGQKGGAESLHRVDGGAGGMTACPKCAGQVLNRRGGAICVQCGHSPFQRLTAPRLPTGAAPGQRAPRF